MPPRAKRPRQSVQDKSIPVTPGDSTARQATKKLGGTREAPVTTLVDGNKLDLFKTPTKRVQRAKVVQVRMGNVQSSDGGSTNSGTQLGDPIQAEFVFDADVHNQYVHLTFHLQDPVSVDPLVSWTFGGGSATYIPQHMPRAWNYYACAFSHYLVKGLKYQWVMRNAEGHSAYSEWRVYTLLHNVANPSLHTPTEAAARTGPYSEEVRDWKEAGLTYRKMLPKATAGNTVLKTMRGGTMTTSGEIEHWDYVDKTALDMTSNTGPERPTEFQSFSAQTGYNTTGGVTVDNTVMTVNNGNITLECWICPDSLQYVIGSTPTRANDDQNIMLAKNLTIEWELKLEWDLEFFDPIDPDSGPAEIQEGETPIP